MGEVDIVTFLNEHKACESKERIEPAVKSSTVNLTTSDIIDDVNNIINSHMLKEKTNVVQTPASDRHTNNINKDMATRVRFGADVKKVYRVRGLSHMLTY